MELSGLYHINEPKMEFNVERHAPYDIHPLKGLKEYGPYSLKILPIHNIRIASIHPKKGGNIIETLLNDLNNSHLPKERKNYLPAFDGIKTIFNASIDYVKKVSIDIDTDRVYQKEQPMYVSLAESLTNAIKSMTQRKQDFDVLIIYLPKIWQDGFFDKESNFDLHDFLKASTAVNNIPTQIILEEGAINYNCRCSVMWRLSIALYVKAGGTPWKLASIDQDSAFIGLSYASRKNENSGRFDFTTCCSQVFDSDGTGLEFLAYDTNGIETTIGKNPFLTREEMRNVMSRSLDLYLKRHSGRLPKRLIVHKTTHFTKNEIDGAFDSIPANVDLELLQIIQDTPWKGTKYDKYNKKWTASRFPINRGTYFQLGSQEILLWTQGNVQINGKSFYKEGKGIPSPLLIRRFAGYGGWDQNCQAIMGLTKMNWNHDGLYDRLPVTLGFASVLARTVKRMNNLVNKPYEFRYFM